MSGPKISGGFDDEVKGAAETVAVARDDAVLLRGGWETAESKEMSEQIQHAAEATSLEREKDVLKEVFQPSFYEDERQLYAQRSKTYALRKATRKEQGVGGAKAKLIDPREAVSAVLLLVGVACLFVSRASADVQGKASLQWVAIASITVSLVPLGRVGVTRAEPLHPAGGRRNSPADFQREGA